MELGSFSQSGLDSRCAGEEICNDPGVVGERAPFRHWFQHIQGIEEQE